MTALFVLLPMLLGISSSGTGRSSHGGRGVFSSIVTPLPKATSKTASSQGVKTISVCAYKRIEHSDGGKH